MCFECGLILNVKIHKNIYITHDKLQNLYLKSERNSKEIINSLTTPNSYLRALKISVAGRVPEKKNLNFEDETISPEYFHFLWSRFR